MTDTPQPPIPDESNQLPRGPGGRTPRPIAPRGGGGGFDDPPPPGGDDGDDPPPEEEAPNPNILPRPDASRRTNPAPRFRELTINATQQCIPIVYGTQRVGGQIIYVKADGNDLWLAVAFSEGPVNAITDFTVDEVNIAPSSPVPVPIIYGGGSGNTIAVYLGEFDQIVDPTLAALDENWVSALPGLAYAVLHFNIMANDMDSVNPFNIKATVQGMLVLDHREDPTMVTRYFTENAALCLFDLFTNRRYALGADISMMDLVTWDAAADICDLEDGVVAGTGAGPTTAPTVAFVPLVVGGMSGGTREWGYSFVDSLGIESTISPESAQLTVPAGQFRTVDLTGLELGGTGIVSRRMYRRKIIDGEPGPWAKPMFGSEIPDNVTTTKRDSSPDGFAGGTPPPSLNEVLQFRLCLRMDSPASFSDWLETIRGHFNAFVTYNNGKYQCFVDTVVTPTAITFDETTDITGNLTLRSKGVSEIPTRVVVGYVDHASGFKDAEAFYEDPLVSLGVGLTLPEKREFRYSYLGIPTYDQAYRVAKWSFKRGQRDKELLWRSNTKGALPIPGSVVTVSHTGLGFPASLAIVTNTGPIGDSIAWSTRAELYDPSDYDDGVYHGRLPPPGPPGDPPPPPQPPPPEGADILRMRVYMTNTMPVAE